MKSVLLCDPLRYRRRRNERRQIRRCYIVPYCKACGAAGHDLGESCFVTAVSVAGECGSTPFSFGTTTFSSVRPSIPIPCIPVSASLQRRRASICLPDSACVSPATHEPAHLRTASTSPQKENCKKRASFTHRLSPFQRACMTDVCS